MVGANGEALGYVKARLEDIQKNLDRFEVGLGNLGEKLEKNSNEIVALKIKTSIYAVITSALVSGGIGYLLKIVGK